MPKQKKNNNDDRNRVHEVKSKKLKELKAGKVKLRQIADKTLNDRRKSYKKQVPTNFRSDFKASLGRRVVIGNSGFGGCDSVNLNPADEVSFGNGLTICKDERNSKFSIKGIFVSGFTSTRDVARLRGGGYTGLGNGSGGGGGLSSSGGAGFSSNGDDAAFSSRGADIYNRANSSGGVSTMDDRGFGANEWVRRTSATDENVGNRDSETAASGETSFYYKDGVAGTSKFSFSMEDSYEHRPENDGFNLNRKADDYSSNRFDDYCGREGRYDGSFNMRGDGGLSHRGGGRTFGGRGDDHYSQRDGGFGGGGDGGLSIRDNSGFAVRGDAGLGVREYDAFGSKRDGGFDNRDSGSFGAGGDNGLGIRDDGGFGGKGDGGFCNRDGGGFNESGNKSGYSHMSNAVFSRKTERHSDNRGSLEGSNEGQEVNRGFNTGLNGRYNKYDQENRARSSGYGG